MLLCHVEFNSITGHVKTCPVVELTTNKRGKYNKIQLPFFQLPSNERGEVMKSNRLKKEIRTKVIHVGLIFKDERYQDQWIVLISQNNKTEHFNYSTGIGHRYDTITKKKYMPKGKLKDCNPNRAWIEENTKAVKPGIDDILYCLIMDSGADQQSFDDWCEDFGYDSDSIKVRKMYELCQENAQKMNNLGFDMDELQTLFQDY